MTNWFVSNGIALVALAVSIGLAFLRISEWRSSRHRVYVACRSVTAAVPQGVVALTNRSYVAITVTTEGRPIAVNAVRFEIVGEAPDPSQGPVMSSVDSLLAPYTSDLPPIGFGEPVNLASGTSKMWTVSLSVPPFDYTTFSGYLFRCTVKLTNGKSFNSEPFWHVPSPPDGWSKEHLSKAFDS